jgi:RecA/RadA recombinase
MNAQTRGSGLHSDTTLTEAGRLRRSAVWGIVGEDKAKAMGALARADLETLLRAKKLDRTLIPAMTAEGEGPVPTGLEALDAELGGGLPRGELSEIVGPRSSGRTTLTCRILASGVAAGEIAALVDAFDRFDPESAAAAGVPLDRLLWVRGQTISVESAIDLAPALDRAVKAFNLVLQAGGFAVAALDIADAPPAAVRRLPLTTWFRLARAVESGRTAAVVIAPEHLARSPRGVTIALDAVARWRGASARARMLDGLSLRPRVPSRMLA